MDTQEHTVQNKGKMLVFDLARKLKVVGTYHALNQNDKILLEQLTAQSDFVASEGWERRERDIEVIYGTRSLKYDPVVHKDFVCGVLSSFYKSWLEGKNQRNIRHINREIFRLTGVKRNTNECEFDFCRKVAKEKGKDFYFVDFAFEEFYTRVLNQSAKDKIRQMLGIDKLEEVALLDNIDSERDRRMPENLVKREGRIENMKRKGLLVVGYTHALNYLSGKHSDLLQ